MIPPGVDVEAMQAMFRAISEHQKELAAQVLEMEQLLLEDVERYGEAV